MNDDFISQEEIDALLKGGIDNNDSASADTSPNSDLDAERLSDIERDALGEIGNISMGSAATTLSVLLGHRVSITTPQVSIDTLASIKNHSPMP